MRRFFALLAGIALAIPLNLLSVQAANLSFLEINFGEPTATLPLDRFLKHKFTIKNTDSKAHTVSFSIRVKDTDQEIVGWPQPQMLYFNAGETLNVQTFLDENWGKIDKNEVGNHTRTVLWNFEESGQKRSESVTYKYSVIKDADVIGPTTFTGKVVDTKSKPVSGATVSLTTGNFTKSTTSGTDGSFTFKNMPERSDWQIKATNGGQTGTAPAGVGGVGGGAGQAQPGNPGAQCAPPPAPCNPPSGTQPAPNQPVSNQPGAMNFIETAHAASSAASAGYAFVEPGKTDYTITLKPASLESEYTVSKTVTSNIGYWKGDVDDAEQYVLVVQGMENWADPNLKSKPKLELYTIDGEKKWAYDMGWEGWGVDLSKDAKYAAFTTSNSTKTLGVIDAATGKALWTKTGKEFAGGVKVNNAAEGGGIDSKEVAISSTNKYLGVGHGGGNIFVADLLTGKVAWSTDLKGQVRGIVFDKTDEYVYAGSGDGNAYKLKVSDGSIVWKADIGSWPFTNGFKLSADGKYLGSASKVGEVTVIDTQTGKQLWQFDQQGNASILDFSPDGKYVFAGGGGSGASTLYEAATGKKLWRLDRFSHEGKFSADGKYIMIGDVNIDFYDLNGNRVGGITPSGEKSAASQGQFAFVSKDGTKVVYSRRDMAAEGNALLFATGKMTPVASADSANDTMTTLATTTESAKKGSSSLIVVLTVVLLAGAAGAIFILWKRKKAVTV
ncbi:MAG TPA: PQQ-binding-like beta-propeller repeat protein [Patescibacteria group bacterium]